MPHSALRPRALLTAISCAVLVACGGNDVTLPDLTQPAQLQVVSGNGQAGAVGSLLADPLVIRVLDSRDRPVPSTRVAFLAGSGAVGSVVTPDTISTDADGRASVRWSLGQATGTQQLLARVVGNAAVTAAFSAVAGQGVAARVELVSGDNQSATAGSPLPDSLVMRALDASGNPVAGVTVTWSVTGGGSVSAPGTVTRADGTSGILRVLGTTAGAQSTVASVDGAAGSPLVFNATGTVGSVGALVIQVAPASTARSGAAFSTQPQLQLVDANHNPVSQPGLAVTASIGSGPAGATLVGSATAATNASGLAVFTNLGISGASGTYAVVFSAAGAAGVTSDPIQLSAGSATQLAMVQQPPPSVATGVVLSPAPAVQLEDASGNGVSSAGVPVTVTLSGGGGTLAGTLTVSTDASGRATFADLTVSGTTGDRMLLFTSAGLTSVESGPFHVVGEPSAATSTIEAPAAVVAGVNATVVVTVRDAASSLLPGVSVTLNASGTANTIAPAVATTDASGVATFTFSSTKAEDKSLTAAAGSANIGPVTVTVTPADGDPAHTTATISDGRTFRTTKIPVVVYDQFGNRVTIGGADMAASVSGSNSLVDATVKDNQDGSYVVSYTPLFAGTDQISITLSGTPIQGSPFTSKVRN